MQQPKEYYQAQISRLTILLKKHRQRRNGITLTKVFLFLLAIYFIYTFANTGYTPYLIAFIAAIALFIITNIFETKLLKEIQFLHKLEECSRVELEYLAGNFKNLPTGEEYKDPSHPYAHDLDVFGEDNTHPYAMTEPTVPFLYPTFETCKLKIVEPTTDIDRKSTRLNSSH